MPAEPPPEPSSDQQRLEQLLEYRTRALRRRRRVARVRIATGILACGLALLAAVVTAGRMFRRDAAPLPSVAVQSQPVEPADRHTPAEAEPDPSAAPQELGPVTEPPAPIRRRQSQPFLAAPRTRSPETRSPELRSPETRSPGSVVARVRVHPPDRLAALARGDTKERVFELFATTFQREGEAMVRTDGIRLRARSRSPRHPEMEVAEVRLADDLRWFLFDGGRLVAWGRPQEWCAVAARHDVDLDYPATPCAATPGAAVKGSRD
jgi:hypothetical protein